MIAGFASTAAAHQPWRSSGNARNVADDAADGAEHGGERHAPVAERGPQERGDGPVGEAVGIRVRVAVAEHRHAPRQMPVVPEIARDPPDVHVVVHAVGRQHDAVGEVDRDHHDPDRGDRDQRDLSARYVVGRLDARVHRVGQEVCPLHDVYAGPPTSSSSRTGLRCFARRPSRIPGSARTSVGLVGRRRAVDAVAQVDDRAAPGVAQHPVARCRRPSGAVRCWPRRPTSPSASRAGARRAP